MLPNGEGFTKAYKTRRRRHKWFLALASVVVFCTVYALVLPAITMEQTCALAEHTHTQECYTQITAVSVTRLQCGAQAHSHTGECGSDCGYADYLIHTHDSSCYDSQGALWCPLPQIREHIHGEGCYSVPEGHSHGMECFTRQRGELTCQTAEGAGHTHGEECRDEEGALICQTEESQGHTHDDDCYSWTEELTCSLPEEPEGEPVLVCQQSQIQAHQHDVTCAEGHNCQMLQILMHTHGPECFVTVEEPVDTETLTCAEEHTHTALCYGTWELTCGLEAHTHSEECFRDEEADPEETTVPVTEETTQDETDSDSADPTRDANETLPPATTPEGMESDAAPVDLQDPEGNGETKPLDVTQYISGAKLFYSTDNGSSWAEITESMGGKVPGNATFKLEVDFKGVNPEALRQAGYTMTYQMPELLKKANTGGDLLEGNEPRGSITVSGGVATLTFDKVWVDGFNKDTDSISGKFQVSGHADLSVAEKPGGTIITVGSVTIKIPFEDKLIAQYGDVELDKTLVELEEGENGRFLCYTLTVTAGEYGCPGVVVKDQVKEGADYVEKNESGFLDYQEITPGVGTTEVTQEGLTWTVGDLNANDTKTLTYKLPLTKEYLGARPNGKPVINTAKVFSDEFERDTSTASFTPTGKVTLSKMVTKFEKNEKDDGGILRYTVWVHADQTNNYTFDNLYIWDALDGTVDGGNKTDEALLPFLSYQNFALYRGGKQDQNGHEGLVLLSEDSPTEWGTDKKSFKYPVGDLKPGESKTLVYEVKVDQGIFTTGNTQLKIKNRATVLSDPNRENGRSDRLENYNQEYTMDGKTWVWKQEGEPISEEKTIPMSDNGSFTVPAGSYRYEVGVNESGEWDVSGATLKDDLNSTHMIYVGYVRVDAYKKTNGVKADQPYKTIWIKIEGETSFTFVPQDQGLSKGTDAYRLTYYAQPQNMGSSSTVVVANEFHLTGDVIGVDSRSYTLGSVWVSASVRVEGQNAFYAAKRFWYYDAPNTETNDGNGAMYWIIEAKGNKIPSGTKFRDTTAEDRDSHTIDSAPVCAFIGNLDELSEYPNLSALPTDKPFTNYTSKKDDNSLTLTLTEDVELPEQETLYFVVRTVPNALPQGDGQYKTYANNLETQDPGEERSWTPQSGDQHTIVGGGSIYKTLADVFQAKADNKGQVTEQTVTFNDVGDTKTELQYDHLACSGPGIYAAWKVTINQDSTLSGSYRIREQIPTGMKMIYIQRYSTGNGYQNRPTFGQILDLSDYTPVTLEYSTYYDKNPTPTYLYVKGQEVIWQVDGLKADYTKPGAYYATYLVVCKVTDPAVLLGGETKTFDNQVSLLTMGDVSLGNDVSSVTLGAPKLSKTGTYKDTMGSEYPFQIQVNELGMDLVAGTDTIVLEDTMCDILTLKPETIQVVNTVTEEPVTGWEAAVDGQTLRLTLPDNIPLTITYTTTIHAKPGEQIEISNNAHWFGYSNTSGSSVKEENFSYSAGGSVSGEHNVRLEIQKRDSANVATLLQGAEFELVQVDGALKPVESFTKMTGTTDENGKLTFGVGDQKLAYNTIYRLTETKAPDGYVVNSTPHYFMVCKADEYVGDLKVPTGVEPVYNTATYSYTAYNSKGEVQVNKQFQNAAGEILSGAISGTYRFAIYDSKLDGSTTPEPKKIITHVYSQDGSVQTEKFTGLEVWETYYVYELGDKGAPILPGQEGTANAMPFMVSYEGNEVTVTAQPATVTVTNRMNYQELPSTGGSGILGFWLLGVALILGGAGLLDKRKRLSAGL